MGDLSLERIREIGGIVSAKTEQRDVTWTGVNPDTGRRKRYTHTVEVRRMAFGWIERTMRDIHAQANGHDTDRSMRAAMIAGGIVLEGGQQLSYAEAYQLAPSLAEALLEAFYDVNGLTAVEPDPDPETSAKN
jgi:hypothetical protein